LYHQSAIKDIIPSLILR